MKKKRSKLYTYEEWSKKYEAKQKKIAKKERKPVPHQYSLYALELEGGNYYVGLTSIGVHRRYLKHLDGTGSQWTKIHKPLRILEERPLGLCKQTVAEMMENNMTIEYMDKYGIARVRGGSMCCVRTESNMGAYNSFSKVIVTKTVSTDYWPKSERRDERYQHELVASLHWITED